MFLEQEVEPAKRQRSLELLRDAGVGWIRQELPWEQIEPVAKGQTTDPKFGDSTWAKFDDIVERANRAGPESDPARRHEPALGAARRTRRTVSARRVNDADYWDFVSQVATRYRGKVAAYQVWNEPNLNSEWGRQPPDAAAYARLLRGASERIHAADPSARVLMAALAPTLTENADALNELIYLQQLYDAGVRGHLRRARRAGVRPARRPGRPARRPLGRDVFAPAAGAAGDGAQWRRRHARSGRRRWAGTSIRPTCPNSASGGSRPACRRATRCAPFERVREQWPWMQVVCIWYWKRPDETNRNQDWFWFRLADPDFTLQPVYYALRDAALTGWR